MVLWLKASEVHNDSYADRRHINYANPVYYDAVDTQLVLGSLLKLICLLFHCALFCVLLCSHNLFIVDLLLVCY